MAMTKKEREEMAQCKAALATARALSWPMYKKPAPFTREELRFNLVVGWFANTYRGEVSQGCSNGVDHSTLSTTKTTTQGVGTMYATRVEALKVVRILKTEEFARKLAELDALIAAEEG